MSDLPYQLVKKIMDGYIAEKYCHNCFDNHNISETYRINDDRYFPRAERMNQIITEGDIFNE